MSTRNSLSVLTVIGLLAVAGCSTPEKKSPDGKSTVTQTTTTTTTLYPLPMPNPTPYGGIPAFVGQKLD